MGVIVYYTSVTGCAKTRNRQSQIFALLDSKKIPYDMVDISINRDSLNEMREKSGISDALAPQIFNDDSYCGDHSKFYDAVEISKVEEFLQLK